MNVDTSNNSTLVVTIRRLGELAVNAGAFVFLWSVNDVHPPMSNQNRPSLVHFGPRSPSDQQRVQYRKEVS